MDAVAEHVVVVAHDDAVLGVDDLALVAFDVEHDAGGDRTPRWRIGRGVSLYLNLLWATVRKVRPSESAWATVGVAAWTAALSRGGLFLRPESRRPCAAACQVGR